MFNKSLRILLTLSLGVACSDQSRKLKEENRDLAAERDEARKKQQEAEAERRSAEAASQNAEAKRRNEEAERRDAEAERDKAEQASREDKERAAAAEANLKVLRAEVASSKELNKSAEKLLKAVEGVWILDESRGAVAPENCSVMSLVSAEGPGSLRDAIVCDDGNMQLITHTAAAYRIRGDLFPGSLGLEFVSDQDRLNTTCDTNIPVWNSSSSFVFDYSTGSGASAVTFMTALDPMNNQSFYQSAANLSEFSRNNSCDNIRILAERAALMESAISSVPKNVLLHRAKMLCDLNQVKLGCFTSAGFIVNQD